MSGVKEEESWVNGVSVETLRQAVNSIKEQASLGRYQFRASNQWLDGGHTRSTVKEFFGAGREQNSRPRPLVVESDIPALFEGNDRGMDPVEHLLAALAASVTTMLVWHAAARGIHLDAIDTDVEGDLDLQGCLGLDKDLRPGYEEIRVTVSVEADSDPATLDTLVQLAARYSPLFDTLSRGTRLLISRER